ncbi:WD repeat-containing protein 75-like [Paramacrobiotus metropolitanus]|uniref:WD repeat-containing protein 75-like n=1 Tax=Paramacrobiotus metropolitanus TaxID=2943436 RepID=UPI00244632D2|nr:WD repeat-containing protein 75-like [Paramacrobiotus metropolitanus]
MPPNRKNDSTDSGSEPMDLKNDGKLAKGNDKVAVNRIGGSRKMCRRCLLSPDGRKVLALVDHAIIQVFRTSDGKLSHCIDLNQEPGATKPYSSWCSLVLWPHDPNRLICAVSEDGWILLVSYDCASTAVESRCCARWKLVLPSKAKPAADSAGDCAQRLAGIHFQHPQQPADLRLNSCSVFGLVRSVDRGGENSQKSDESDTNAKSNGATDHCVIPFSLCSLTMDMTVKVHQSASDKIGKVRPKNGLIHQLTPDLDKVAFHTSGEFVAAISESELKMYFFNQSTFRRHLSPGKIQFTCLTSHPTQQCVATGDRRGRIILWYGLENPSSVTRCILHWHSSSVGDVVFSSQGSFLWSGGSESTLVQWSMADTAHKDFLPRMAAPIEGLSFVPTSGGSTVAVHHRNNTITLVGAQRNILARIDDLCSSFSSSTNSESIHFVRYDPNNAALVLPGQPGQLAFYGLTDRNLIDRVDVTGQNVIWSAVEGWDSVNSKIDAVAFLPSVKGSPGWMITADSITTKHIGCTLHLRFWTYGAERNNKYSVESLVLDPHDGQEIRSIIACQSAESPIVVTLVPDGFKLWILLKAPKPHWICTGQGRFCDLPVFVEESTHPCVAVSFSGSKDGVLAVAFGTVVVLFEVGPVLRRRNVLLEGLTHPVVPGGLRFVNGKNNQCLLYAVTKSELVLWNIRAGQAIKRFPWNFTVICLDFYSRWLVIGGNKSVAIMDVDEWASLATDIGTNSPPSFTVLEERESEIISCLCVPRSENADLSSGSWDIEFRIVVLTNRGELWSVGLGDEPVKPTAEKEDAKSFYEEVMKNLAVQKMISPDVSDNLQLQGGNKTQLNFVQQVISAPAYLMPSVSFLVGEVIKSMIHEKDSVQNIPTPVEAVPTTVNLNRDDDDDAEPMDTETIITKEESSGITKLIDEFSADFDDVEDWSFLKAEVLMSR